MKKRIFLFVLLMFFLNIVNANASQSMCIYNINKYTVKLTYDYDKPSINTEINKGSGASSAARVKFIHVSKADFVDSDGNLICPKLKLTSKTPYDNHKFNLTYASSPDGTITGTLKILINDGKEKNNGVVTEPTYDDCIYNKGEATEFILTWTGSQVVVTLSGSKFSNYCAPQIMQETFSSKDFENGKCPEKVYDQIVARYENLSGCRGRLIVSNESILTENDLPTGNDNNPDLNTTNQKTPLLGKVTCETIFKNNGVYNRTYKILNSSLRFMQYLAISLALILSVVDFIKVVPSQDKGLLKKSAIKAATRLGLAIIIFLGPILLNFVLELIGFNDPTCGLFNL